jgi:hypothetical protein
VPDPSRQSRIAREKVAYLHSRSLVHPSDEVNGAKSQRIRLLSSKDVPMTKHWGTSRNRRSFIGWVFLGISALIAGFATVPVGLPIPLSGIVTAAGMRAPVGAMPARSIVLTSAIPGDVSSARTLQGAPRMTTTDLSTSPAGSVAQGNPVTLYATVTPTTATGTVQFKDGATNLGPPVTVSDGTVSGTTSQLAVGSHQLTAVFTPSEPAVFSPSASLDVRFTVTGPIRAADTTTTLTVFPNVPIPQGVPVLLKATVVPDSATGAVQFQDGATALGNPVPVVSGSATLITSRLTQGTHTLTAVFIPTSPTIYGPSTSPPVSLPVTGSPGEALLEQISTRLQQLIAPILDPGVSILGLDLGGPSDGHRGGPSDGHPVPCIRVLQNCPEPR